MAWLSGEPNTLSHMQLSGVYGSAWLLGPCCFIYGQGFARQNVNSDRLGSQLCSLNRTRETLRLGGTIQKDLLTGRCHSPVTIRWEIKGFLGEWHGSFQNSCFRNMYARSQIPHFWISSLEWIPFYTTRTLFFFWQMTLNNHTRTKMAKLILAMFEGFSYSFFKILSYIHK